MEREESERQGHLSGEVLKNKIQSIKAGKMHANINIEIYFSIFSYIVCCFLTLNCIVDLRRTEGRHAAPLSLPLCLSGSKDLPLCLSGSKDLNCKPLIHRILHTVLLDRFYQLLILHDQSKYQCHRNHLSWTSTTRNTPG